MATQSAGPFNPTVDNPQNPAPEVVQTAMEDRHDPKSEANGGISPTSVFVNSELMREDQVQNAVKFLSHSKVRGSPVMYRRSFLEKKGLSKEEIDEAFRRVPDPPQNVPTGSNQDGQMKSLSNVQPQVSTQTLQPSAASPAGVISMTLARSRFHWSHALLAVGFLAVSGAGTAVLFKNAIVPRLKSWIRKVVHEEEELPKKTNSKPSLEEIAAAAAAAEVARTSQEMLVSKTEEKKCFEELVNLVGVQVQEMKSMSNAIRKLEVVCSSPPSKVEPSAAPHPKSYMEEIKDLPSNPNQPLPNRHLPPRAKPWEVSQNQNSSSHVFQSQEGSYGLNSNLPDNGLINHLNGGDSSAPWWQRKNVRITEIENENEFKSWSSSPVTGQRSWVPPQPPLVVMPEAAAAIRQPKKPFSQKQPVDDQLVANPPDAIDELQRITKISESGGAADASGGTTSGLSGQISESEGGVNANGGNLGLIRSEIQELEEY